MDDRTALHVWDAAGARGALRAAAVAAALRGVPADELLDVPLGDLDREFLRECADAVGPALEVELDCAACGEPLDLEIGIDALLAAPVASGALRQPTTRALLAAEAAADPADALYRWSLCPDGAEAAPLDRAAAARALVAIDPLLDAEVASSCPSCGAEVLAVADPLRALAAAARMRVRSLLSDVVSIARGTGWAEHEILAMPARRRRLYLELIGA